MSEVKVQCPECGGMIKPGIEWGMYRCSECHRIYTEGEVRERCGL